MSSKHDRKRRSIPKIEFTSICVICETEIKGNKSKLQDNGWNNFKIQAKRWQEEIAIPSGDGKDIYTKLYKIKIFDWAQGFAHLSCRTNLRTKVAIYAKRYAETEVIVEAIWTYL